MNRAKQAVVRTQKFVADHKVAIAVTATAAVTTVVAAKIRRGALDTLHEFLDERGLTDDFITFVAEKNQN